MVIPTYKDIYVRQLITLLGPTTWPTCTVPLRGELYGGSLSLKGATIEGSFEQK